MDMKKFTARVPIKQWERFKEFAEKKGYKQERAIAASMLLFEALPVDIRELLMEGNIKEAKRRLGRLAASPQARLADAVADDVVSPTPGGPPASRKKRGRGRKGRN